MSDAVFMTIAAAVAATLLLVSGAAFRCNLRQYIAARATAPLEGMDLAEAAIAPQPAPRGWPPIEEVTDPRVAAAYASLADDRATTFALTGELTTLIGGGAIGATLPLIGSGFKSWWIIVALVPTLFGMFLSRLTVWRWEPVAARYRERYALLTAQPAPLAPTPPRRSLVASLLRR